MSFEKHVACCGTVMGSLRRFNDKYLGYSASKGFLVHNWGRHDVFFSKFRLEAPCSSIFVSFLNFLQVNLK
jgi:hypothetical protein